MPHLLVLNGKQYAKKDFKQPMGFVNQQKIHNESQKDEIYKYFPKKDWILWCSIVDRTQGTASVAMHFEKIMHFEKKIQNVKFGTDLMQGAECTITSDVDL